MRISDLSSDVCSSDLAGRVAVCLGIGASRFLKRIGIKVPIWPMKGYSFTAPPGAAAPRVSITDTARKIVFCRLDRSEEHTSELQSLMRFSYAVFCLKK